MFGSRFRSLRKILDLSQETFSEKLGISRVTVSNWEHDRTMPSIRQIPEIAKLLGMDINSFYAYLYDDNDFFNANSPLSEILTLYQELNDSGKESALLFMRFLVNEPKFMDNLPPDCTCNKKAD